MNKRKWSILVICLIALILLVVFVVIPRIGDTETKNPNSPAYGYEDPTWWNHAVFYEIFVRSFYDSNGDGIGDFNGITEKLDYLNDGDPNTTTDLGVNAIWLMPIYPSPSYHGYDVTDYMTVNPEYGTLEDFQNLVNEAHKRGIHVIIDFVINHTSDKNSWFVSALDPNSPYHDWYIWSDTNPGYKGPWGEEVWHPATNGLFYYGIFTAQMPDLNYRNQTVTDEIEKIAKFWLTDMNVDGLRVDGARHLIEDGQMQANTPETLAWFKDFHELYQSWKPSAMSVGEVWDSSYNATKYIEDKSFDLVFDFDLASAIISGINMGSASAINAHVVAETGIFKNGGMATFLTNHDMDRVMNQLKKDPVKAGHAATVLLTIPGTPFIYYGEEIGMVGQKPDEQIRSPMQWSKELSGGFTKGSPWSI
jgi:glycosidase